MIRLFGIRSSLSIPQKYTSLSLKKTLEIFFWPLSYFSVPTRFESFKHSNKWPLLYPRVSNYRHLLSKIRSPPDHKNIIIIIPWTTQLFVKRFSWKSKQGAWECFQLRHFQTSLFFEFRGTSFLDNTCFEEVTPHQYSTHVLRFFSLLDLRQEKKRIKRKSFCLFSRFLFTVTPDCFSII